MDAFLWISPSDYRHALAKITANYLKMKMPVIDTICLDEPLLDKIADALQRHGFILLSEFLPAWLGTQLQQLSLIHI